MARFRLRQNNQIVAQTEGPLDRAEAGILAYARQYQAEGEVTVQVQHISPSDPNKRNWKRYAVLAKWPDENIAP